MEIITPSYEILQLSPSPLEEIEYAARTCYRSHERTGPGSAEKLVRSLVTRGHEAMLEFADMTVKFVTSRGITHEFVRQRLCSFAQSSTRYCDEGKAGSIRVVCPPELETHSEAFHVWEDAMLASEAAYVRLRDCGFAAQISRDVLPTCLAAELVVKANMREWRHIFTIRTGVAAHPHFRALLSPLLRQVQSTVPVLFEDITPYTEA